MTEERVRTVLAWRKATLWVLFVLCILELLQKDSVLNGLWLFCTAGVVPWRKQSLAPNTVLMILAGFVGVIILVVIIRMIVKIAQRRRDMTRKLRTEESLAIEPLQTEKNAEVSHGIEESETPKAASVEPATQTLPHLPVIIVKQRAATSFPVLPLLRMGAYALAYLVWAMHFLEAIIRRAARWSVKTGVKTARWLIPQLWQFDTWLEEQTHKHLAKARKKAVKHQKLQDLALFGRESRHAITARLPVVRTAKNEQMVSNAESQ